MRIIEEYIMYLKHVTVIKNQQHYTFGMKTYVFDIQIMSNG